MQKDFQGSISGKKIFLPLLISMLVIIAATVATIWPLIASLGRPGAVVYGVITYFALTILFTAVSIYIYFVLIRETILGISLDEEPEFRLSVVTFFWKNLLWSFLTLITLGIYTPWYIRNAMNLIGENTSYQGKTYRFLGKPGDLLGRYIVVWIGMLAANLYLNFSASDGGFIVSFLLIIVLQMVLYAIVTVWMIDVEYDGRHISYKGGIGGLVGKMLAEFLLAVITLGIYAPAAMFGITRYVINQVSYGENSRLVQSGNKLPFFGWAWLQILLCIITLGIYSPWAYAKLMNIIIDKTALVTEEDSTLLSDDAAV